MGNCPVLWWEPCGASKTCTISFSRRFHIASHARKSRIFLRESLIKNANSRGINSLSQSGFKLLICFNIIIINFLIDLDAHFEKNINLFASEAFSLCFLPLRRQQMSNSGYKTILMMDSIISSYITIRCYFCVYFKVCRKNFTYSNSNAETSTSTGRWGDRSSFIPADGAFRITSYYYYKTSTLPISV